MAGKISAVIFLFCTAFESVRCAVSHQAFRDRCEFNFTNGNWDEFSNSVPAIHTCIKQFIHCELSVHLNNYSLPAFPNGTFLNLKRNLSLKLEVTNSQVQLLSPSLPNYSLFQNSVFHSVTIDISDSSTLIGWHWKALQDMTLAPGTGLEFNVVRSKLVYLHSDFSKVANGRVTEVRILKCGLRWLGREVFAQLLYLKTLELRDNLLEDVRRSHLPASAPALKSLDLGNNRLESLPQDIFDGLSLKTVYLDGNNLRISEPLALSILNEHNLLVSGVIWHCNCVNFLQLILKMGERDIREEQCYTDQSSKEVFMYWKRCHSLLKTNVEK